MKISKLKIINYKLFRDVSIVMNNSVNIFAGENDSGKTTILEALTMALTGKINSSNVINRLNLDWFNAETRKEFKQAIKEGKRHPFQPLRLKYISALLPMMKLL